MKGSPSGFWAKLNFNDEGEVTDWHPLLAHSADVAAMCEALMRKTILRKRVANLINWQNLSDSHISRLAALAAIHDAGKVNHGFQNRAFSNIRPTAGHVSPIVEVINANNQYKQEILLPLGIAEMQSWFSDDEDLPHFLLATWGHHGKPVIPQNDFKPSLWDANQTRDPLKGIKELGRVLQDWFPEAFKKEAEAFPSTHIFQHVYNGVLTLADWLGSDPRFFEFADEESDYIQRARINADKAIKSLVLDADKARIQLGDKKVEFDSISDWTPYEIQQTCMDLPTHENGSLTVLESDTGSGKTEAALARFLRLYQAGLVDGMYFAVPTRSAATQLYHRVKQATDKAFHDSSGKPPVVQAVSGYIRVDEIEGVPLPKFDVQWPEDQRDYLRERGWAAEHPKRYLAGGIVVGTIDQIFLSTLQVKHAHMRAAALLRHFLVVDEVHASDVYMTKLLNRVLDLHLSAGGHALLMSATLGTASRIKLTSKKHEPIPSSKEALNSSYPLITHVDGARKRPESYSATSSGINKKVATTIRNIASSPSEVAELALSQAEKGARVLVIRNRVKDCYETQQALEKTAGQNSEYLFKVNSIPAPHHSRYAAKDRMEMDRKIETVHGKNSTTRSKVTIATQTVEQSLDIDADLLITDLCPIDVLLQRIGRLHRHFQERPKDFEEAECVVLTPFERDLSKSITNEGAGFKGAHGMGTVYQDLRVLEATWRVLEQDSDKEWLIPDNNRSLVERATHPEIVEGIVEEMGGLWEKHQEYIAGSSFADNQLANLVGLELDKPFGDAGFADDLKQVKTRLGQDDYKIQFPNPIIGPFGNSIDELTISENMFDRPPEDSQINAQEITKFKGGFSFEYNGKKFRYDRLGLTLEEG